MEAEAIETFHNEAVGIRRASGDDMSDTSGSGEFSSAYPNDEELATLAMCADPHPVIDAHAIPWTGRSDPSLSGLPDWYMPPSIGLVHSRTVRVVVACVVAGFLLVDASGLCNTFGFFSWA
jgi:hypothetical protein